MNTSFDAASAPPARLLIVDDDVVFCGALSRAMEKRGFQVRCAHNVNDALRLASGSYVPDKAIVDLSMPGESGLVLIEELKRAVGNIEIVVLTGFASIATAVEAIKLGAVHYLTKPADADEIASAFDKKTGRANIDFPQHPMSVDRLEWEHIQKVLRECQGNISQTARRLGMHRRTLQRKLGKNPPKYQRSSKPRDRLG